MLQWDLTSSEKTEMQNKRDEARKWYKQYAKASLVDIEMQIESLQKKCEKLIWYDDTSAEGVFNPEWVVIKER